MVVFSSPWLNKKKMTHKYRNFSFHKSSGDEIHARSSAYVTHSRGSVPPLSRPGGQQPENMRSSSVSALCLLHLTLRHSHLHTAASELHLFCPLSSLISQNLVTPTPHPQFSCGSILKMGHLSFCPSANNLHITLCMCIQGLWELCEDHFLGLIKERFVFFYYFFSDFLE